MWPISLMMSTKQVPVEAEPALKVCRVCWGGDEDGEKEWIAPCRCPRTIAWVHRSCLAWRLKWTPIGEDKLRCAVCKWVSFNGRPWIFLVCDLPSNFRFAYKKSLRLKSLREWHNGWWEERYILTGDVNTLSATLNALNIFRNRVAILKHYPWWLSALMVYVYLPTLNLVAVLWGLFRIYNAYRQPERFGLAFYKRFLAVAVRDWIIDAPPPPLGSSSATT